MFPEPLLPSKLDIPLGTSMITCSGGAFWTSGGRNAGKMRVSSALQNHKEDPRPNQWSQIWSSIPTNTCVENFQQISGRDLISRARASASSGSGPHNDGQEGSPCPSPPHFLAWRALSMRTRWSQSLFIYQINFLFQKKIFNAWVIGISISPFKNNKLVVGHRVKRI